ncbi:hypothetical protein N1028_01375 [Herbiconiux sp. CPCC 203407]|uniref:Uncharacterized protein n=1 Tax=Herbiconiux oxytropis TaxID=2970915 RepID=A0AA42BVJ6_9MICO|nr:hypothetical protein [Herbiconiux oxytropis]MCS5721461.1 hypothetical protein [Herbiconiux oxytropis]MCS5724538.1 hypothetical protein [Herbiconiux oxytropis]
MNGIDRRSFLRTLGLRAVASAASTRSPEIARPPSLPWPPHPIRCAPIDELRLLALQEGLPLPDAALEMLGRRTVRLTGLRPGTRVAEAWLRTPAGLDNTGRLSAGETIVLDIDRSADALAATELTGTGWLTVELSTDEDEDEDDGDLPVVGRSRCLRIEFRHPRERPSARGGLPLQLDPHLQLPRVWSEPVQELGLDTAGQAAYVRVRDRLAETQGLEADQGAGAGLALHRLLGYPDDTSGTMPAECAEIAGPGEWTLLAQLSIGRASRVFVWTAPGDAGSRTVGLLR